MLSFQQSNVISIFIERLYNMLQYVIKTAFIIVNVFLLKIRSVTMITKTKILPTQPNMQ